MWDVLKEYPAARVRLEAIAVKRLEKYKKAPLEKGKDVNLITSHHHRGFENVTAFHFTAKCISANLSKTFSHINILNTSAASTYNLDFPTCVPTQNCFEVHNSDSVYLTWAIDREKHTFRNSHNMISSYLIK